MTANTNRSTDTGADRVSIWLNGDAGLRVKTVFKTAVTWDTVAVADMADCTIAGVEGVNITFNPKDNTVGFKISKLDLTLKVHTPDGGGDSYFFSFFKPLPKRPATGSIAEMMALNNCTTSGKKRRAKKAA